VQALAVAVAIVFSAGMTFAILKLVGAFASLRATLREEGLGLDVTQHGEEAYGTGEGAILLLPDAGPTEAAAVPAVALSSTGGAS
jgi:Amt family ammonium transporter